MTQAPATPELVERLRSYYPPICQEAADALEAQQARIAELEVENERLRLTMLGGEDVAGFASSLPLAQVLDSFRTYETALRDSANSAQALADRYEKALEFYADPETYHAVTVFCDPPRGAFIDDFSDDHEHPEYVRPMPGKLARQALSSQGRHEGATSDGSAA